MIASTDIDLVYHELKKWYAKATCAVTALHRTKIHPPVKILVLTKKSSPLCNYYFLGAVLLIQRTREHYLFSALHIPLLRVSIHFG